MITSRSCWGSILVGNQGAMVRPQNRLNWFGPRPTTTNPLSDPVLVVSTTTDLHVFEEPGRPARGSSTLVSHPILKFAPCVAPCSMCTLQVCIFSSDMLRSTLNLPQLSNSAPLSLFVHFRPRTDFCEKYDFVVCNNH